jgi:hypothetical protein
MTPDEKQAFVCAGLDCFVFKDFVRGGAGTQKTPAVRAGKIASSNLAGKPSMA